MAAPKSRNTRMPLVPAGASKCLRYVQTCSQLAGSQFCQDSGATVCGRVTVANPLSSNPGKLLPADAAPKSHPALNGTMAAAGPLPAPIAARAPDPSKPDPSPPDPSPPDPSPPGPSPPGSPTAPPSTAPRNW